MIEETEGRSCFVENLKGYALSVADDIVSCEPATYKQAISCSESAQWLAAMGEEMQSLYKNKVWELVKVPEGRKLVGCKWNFKKKEGVDFVEIFSPVVRHASIRVLLSIVAHYDLELEQLDVKTAFLHGDLEEEILMKQPEGFEIPGKEHYACRLLKSLYGLKQSPRQWYKKFDSFMVLHGLGTHMIVVCIMVS